MGNIFDIIGPVMVGPSSSHTAGAVKIGNIARQLFGEQPAKATIYLHGSFAATGKGHGTDKALVAGLLGMHPDDLSIPESFELAKKAGMTFTFKEKEIKDAHPNTALMVLEGEGKKALEIQASSTGGGRIRINKLDGVEVNFRGESNTLIVYNVDSPGHVSAVANVLFQKQINIATVQLYRDKRGGQAVMVIEVDQDIPENAVQWLEHLEGIIKVTFLNVADYE
ncbi:L-serine ammonia-lyase, iron-sulfur-dependent subunit beta [Ohessyouella blattaphilus]|uniref:L-serine deaminase n=1 Tax=Ohessyouella blattaphilus TaxID=2949333 RepID=A0ABT1EE19_9FIRM|nr:L-serine ammonia-lyase, iron-sulfur-dependent subunit beta [Ohessyouella blattaphilus]MCP1108935.1 L-serine ammonia-lyase, iron-sulfur-dependent subunit beta [Ohessyouella blattaphilus]MCR8562329.1 L-serine ammonia-lyase, iron-sulfur-dependent subunit beta [Ohessyouella blattaphilus]MDL2251200.1 L-serine ammonia-lyase, iron-sulfur-dependent subunit beta [Lachnospiraceae bacterium OttesenSCG-928-J05]